MQLKLLVLSLGLVLSITSLYAAPPNYVTINNAEPQKPLVPADTSETGGGHIIAAIFSGLTYFDVKGNSELDLAESITSDDKQTYVVKIKPDVKFSDGTPITADSFVKAWNYAIKEKLANFAFFADIKGFPTQENEKFETLSGLKVIDDHTFTIELNKPIANFADRLAYAAFYPLPEIAFKDMQAYGQSPVSSGPYKLSEPKAWKHNDEITLIPNEYYNGPLKAQNEGINFKFYAQTTAAYADILSDNLDVLDSIPDIIYLTAKDDLGDNYINTPSASSQYLEINVNKAHFKMDEEGKLRRKAISMAINRPEITQIIFNDTRIPAKDYTSPIVKGYNDHLKGSEVLTFNPEEAKKLWAKADDISKFQGKFTLAYNADAPHQPWVDAVANQIKNTLNIDADGDPYPDFKNFLDNREKRTIKLAARSGWQPDYPSADNYLTAFFSTAAIKKGSNYTDYNNPEFDKLVKKATLASNPAESQQYYDQAQEILLQDLPAIPLWYANTTSAHSKKVSNVIFRWDNIPFYYAIKKEK